MSASDLVTFGDGKEETTRSPTEEVVDSLSSSSKTMSIDESEDVSRADCHSCHRPIDNSGGPNYALINLDNDQAGDRPRRGSAKKPATLDDVVKSCDAIYEVDGTTQNRTAWIGSTGCCSTNDFGNKRKTRRRYHSERQPVSDSSRFNRSGGGKYSHYLPIIRWPFMKMNAAWKNVTSSSDSLSKRGSYQDLINSGSISPASSSKGKDADGVYRASQGSPFLQAAPGTPSKEKNWFRRRKIGVDLGRLTMPLNAGGDPTLPSAASPPGRHRHPSDHAVSQPVVVPAAAGKQRHRSCVASASPHSPLSLQSSPLVCDGSGSSCASSVAESKSRKSSGSSSGGGAGGGNGSRIRSFIDTFRPRAKSEHTPPAPALLAQNGLAASSQSVDHSSGLDTIHQGQELSPAAQPVSQSAPRHERTSSGAVKRPRSPAFGAGFVERLRSLSAAGAVGGGPGRTAGHRHQGRMPDPAKLPKASGSGSLVFTKMPLSPNRCGRVRKGYSLDLEVSYPPVSGDADFDVDINELTKELRVSLPSSCPGPGHAFNNNNNLLKSNLWESMDTSGNAETLSSTRNRAPSSETSLVKEGLQVQENSKYIIFRDKSETCLESHQIHWESMSNIDDAYVQFMRRHTCYDLIPTSSKLVVFDTALIVRRAFFGLVYNGVRAAPLWDSKRQQFVGMLTITDFIRILRHYYRSSSIPIEELENQRIQQWRETIHDDREKPLIQVSPEDTLFKAVHQLVVHQVHRLPVIDPHTGNALHILTHKRILKYLSLYMQDIPQPQYMKESIVQMGIGTFKDVATVTADTSLLKVLNMFLDRRVSAMPVVDADNKLIDIYAKFDVINLAARQTYNNLEISVEEALSYRKDRFEGVATCKNTDTLGDVVNKIVKAGVHRLVMVDEGDHVIGIVSLSDLLKFMVIGKSEQSQLNCSQCPPTRAPEMMETEADPAASPRPERMSEDGESTASSAM